MSSAKSGETKINTVIIGGCGAGKCSVVKAIIHSENPPVIIVDTSTPKDTKGTVADLLKKESIKIEKNIIKLDSEINSLLPEYSTRALKRKKKRKKKKRK